MRQLDATSRAVLALAFPAQWSGEVPVPSIDGPAHAEDILKALKKNKIPLLSLSQKGLDLVPSFRDSQAYSQALIQSRDAFVHYRQEFSEISAALDGAGVPHLLMKSAGPFPYESDNFDILIPHGHRVEVDKALEPLGFVPQLHYREDWKFIYKRFRLGKLRSIAHLHEEVSWGVEPFLDIQGLWERAEPSPDDPAFRVPAPRDSVLITMAHGVYENDCIKLGDLLKVHRALERAGGQLDWQGMEAVASRKGWLAGWRWILTSLVLLERRLWGHSCLDAAVALGAVSMTSPDRVQQGLLKSRHFPHPLGLAFSKGLFVRKMLKANALAAIPAKLSGFLRDNLETFWPLPLHRPLIVAVSGMDGAGKSTVMATLHSLADGLEMTHVTVWMRAGNSDLMQALNRVARRTAGPILKVATNDRQGAETTAPSGEERVITQGFIASSWFWLTLVELCVMAQVKIRIPYFGRRVVFCDRYVADSLVDLSVRCGRLDCLKRSAIPWILRFFPKPDLALHLRVDAADAWRRKEQEFTEAQMERRQRDYRQVEFALGLQAIETGAGIEVVQQQVQAYFIANLRAKYGL